MSGLNKNNSTIWGHNLTNKTFQVYYGVKNRFEIELMDKYSQQNKQILSVSYLMESIRYHNESDSYNKKIGFNKAIIYNNNQTTGLLALEEVDNNNLFKNKNYPILDGEITKVLQVNKENKFSFNQFKNRKSKNNLPIFLKERNGVMEHININSITDNFNYDPITGQVNNIKLIQDRYTNYKLVFKLLEFKTNNSIR